MPATTFVHRGIAAVTSSAVYRLSLGLIGALGVGQLLRSALTGVSGRDPITLVGLPTLMAVVTLVACLTPAIPAIRLEPIGALRAE